MARLGELECGRVPREATRRGPMDPVSATKPEPAFAAKLEAISVEPAPRAPAGGTTPHTVRPDRSA